jgi:hypothetical protein
MLAKPVAKSATSAVRPGPPAISGPVASGRSAARRRTLHEAPERQPGHDRTAEERHRLPAGELLDAFHELGQIAAAHRAGNPLQAFGDLLEAAGAEPLLTPVEVVGSAP